MWLKANFAENGDKLFDFVGYLNTLRLLIGKVPVIKCINSSIYTILRIWRLVERPFTFIAII